MPLPDLVQLDFDAQGVAGFDLALEADLVDPGEERQLVPVLLGGEDGHAADLGHRLDDQHAWHDRVAGEMPLEERLVDGHLLDADGAVGGSTR